jgi:membrane protein
MLGRRCRRRLSLRHALIGGATATLLWEVMRHILAWYCTTMSQIQLVYGSLTTATAVRLTRVRGFALENSDFEIF